MDNPMNAQNPNQFEQAQGYLTLTQAHMNQFNQTRDLKWKINTALWTFLAIGINAYASDPKPPGLGYMVLAGGLGLMVIHIWWMYRIQQSLDYDKWLWIVYSQKVEESLMSVKSAPSPPQLKVKLEWVVVESGLTLLLVVLFAVVTF